MPYAVIFTDAGMAKIAAAILPGGDPITIDELAVGDAAMTHAPTATALGSEVSRVTVNVVESGADYVDVEGILPADEGGYTIREFGLFDDEGDLIVVGQYPETYKPLPAEGSARTSVIRVRINIATPEAFTVTVDMSTVLVTQDEFDDHLSATNPHDVDIVTLVPGGDPGDQLVRDGSGAGASWVRFGGGIPVIGSLADVDDIPGGLSDGELFATSATSGLESVFELDAALPPEYDLDGNVRCAVVAGPLIIMGQERGASGVLITCRRWATDSSVWTWAPTTPGSWTGTPRCIALALTDSDIFFALIRDDAASWVYRLSTTGTHPSSDPVWDTTDDGTDAYMGADLAWLDGNVYLAVADHDADVVMEVFTDAATPASVGTVTTTGTGFDGRLVQSDGNVVWLVTSATSEDNLEAYHGATKHLGIETTEQVIGLVASGPNLVIVRVDNTVEALSRASFATPLWSVTLVAFAAPTQAVACGRYVYASGILLDRSTGAVLHPDTWGTGGNPLATNGETLFCANADAVEPRVAMRRPRLWRYSSTGHPAYPLGIAQYQPAD